MYHIRIRRQKSENHRVGATIVESAMVISIVLMFLFGVFEYGRYVYTLQVMENAAREGARMAIAHTQDKTEADIKARVMAKLNRVDQAMRPGSFSVTLQAVILRPKNTSETAGTVLSDWTDASTTDGISIEVKGDFRPVLPTFLRMPVNMPVRTRCIMYSEGN